MATMQQQRPQTNTWSTIFPTEQVTQQQSALFVKKLLAVAISNITYLRTIFPEHAFGDRCLEDLSLKILRDDSACPGACQVIQWVKGCFDALDKKYLKSIVIGIYEDSKDHNAVVETYTFKFGYHREEGVTIFRNGSKLAGAYTEAETRKATIKLLRTIVVLTQTLKPLPDDVMMTMKLYYYDDVTPSTYEPPGFQATTVEDFTFKEKPMNIRVGDVDTPFHCVKLRIKTDCQQFAICEEDEQTTQGQMNDEQSKQNKDMVMDKTVSNIHKSNGSSKQTTLQDDDQTHKAAVGESCGNATIPNTSSSATYDMDPISHGDDQEDKMDTSDMSYTAIKTKKKPSSLDKSDSDGGSTAEGEQRKHRVESKRRGGEVKKDIKDGGDERKEGSKMMSNYGKGHEEVGRKKAIRKEEDENVVRCPCGCNEDDGLMILCAECNVWQHAICFALLSEEDVPETHICVQCSHDVKMKCTDPFLQTFDPVTLQAACLWRRALLASLEFNRIIPPSFARRLGVAVTVSQGLINRLEREGYVRVPMKNKKLGKIVNKDRIRMDGIRKYFEKVCSVGKDQSTVSEVKNSEVTSSSSTSSSRVADITNGASSLSISQHKTTTGATSVLPSPHVTAIQKTEREDSAAGVRRSPRIVAKRVRTTTDQCIEFELSSSQDLECSYTEVDGGGRRKRRKASIASRSILV